MKCDRLQERVFHGEKGDAVLLHLGNTVQFGMWLKNANKRKVLGYMMLHDYLLQKRYREKSLNVRFSSLLMEILDLMQQLEDFPSENFGQKK